MSARRRRSAPAGAPAGVRVAPCTSDDAQGLSDAPGASGGVMLQDAPSWRTRPPYKPPETDAQHLANLRMRIADQEEWIMRCGGTRERYIEHYGYKGHPDCVGDGGEAVWKADQAQLVLLIREYYTLTGEKP